MRPTFPRLVPGRGPWVKYPFFAESRPTKGIPEKTGIVPDRIAPDFVKGHGLKTHLFKDPIITPSLGITYDIQLPLYTTPDLATQNKRKYIIEHLLPNALKESRLNKFLIRSVLLVSLTYDGETNRNQVCSFGVQIRDLWGDLIPTTDPITGEQVFTWYFRSADSEKDIGAGTGAAAEDDSHGRF